MMIKNTFAAFVSFAIAGLFILGGAIAIDAQGRYVGQYSNRDVSDIIRRMEEGSDEFRTDFRRELNSSNLNSSTRNRYNGYVASMENSIDELRKHFDRQDSWWSSRSRVQTVIRNSRNVNNMMNSLPFQRQLERQWNQLRNQINRVADTYDLEGLNGGGWGGGPWNPGNPGGGGNRPPNWLVGTWYWNQGNNRMTIQSNGNIDVNNNGVTARGSFRNGMLVFSDSTASYIRVGNNLRTTNQSNGMVLNWTRNPWTGGGGGDGNANRPPNWATGQWRAVQQPGLTMSIQYDGQVVVTSAGRYYRGTWYNNAITVDGTTSNMVSTGRNRMRGRNTSTGNVVDWIRSNN
jgi:hypothetical protein